MNDHIAKPIDPDQLFGVLLRWVRRAERDVKARRVAASYAADARAGTSDLIIPGVEVAVGLRRTGGNRKRYETLLRKFAEQQASAVDTIKAALSAGDVATAERAAHSLKGAAATLGAISLSESAAKAETAIKKGYGIDEAVSFLSLSLDAVAR